MLYGGTTRALLAYLDFHDVIRLHWSPLLIIEMNRALVKTRRLTREAATLNDALLARAVPNAEVPTHVVQASFRTAYPGVRDAKDLHVAACAVALIAGDYYPSAQTVRLVTKNTKDFSPKKLAALGVRQQHPDTLLLELWQDDPLPMASAFAAFRSDLPVVPEVERVLRKLAGDGQRRTAAAMLQDHLADRVRL